MNNKPELEEELISIQKHLECSDEFLDLVEPIIKREISLAKKQELKWILSNASGGGNWRRRVISRIEELTNKNNE